MKKILAGMLLCASFSAQAALVTLVGDTINYEYDDTQAALGLFGTPTIIGDTVRFLPPAFRAESADGALTDTATANFVFSRVYSVGNNGEGNDNLGADIVELQILERGDYEITNDGTVSGDLYVQAASNVDPFDFVDAEDSFDASGDSGGKQIWTMGASIAPADAFFSAANDMAVTIQNTLTAFTDENGELAWIQKKITFTAGITPIPPIPVPAAAWLFGSALGLLGWLRRRV